MDNHRRFRYAALLLLVIMFSSCGWSQIIYGQPTTGKVQFIYTHWKAESLGESITLSQISFPVMGMIPLKDNLEMRFFGAGVSNSLDVGDNSFSLNGMSDLRLQLNQSLANDQLLLSLGLNLPTGKRELNLEELGVMAVLTQNYISLPIRRLGEGFDANLLVGGAVEMNNMRLGGSVSYLYTAKYVAREGSGEYDPGNWITISADIQGGDKELAWMGSLSYATASVDKLDSRKIYDQGQNFSIGFGLRYKKDKVAANGDVRYLVRGRNTDYDANENITEQLKVFGNEFALGGDLTYAINPKAHLGPTLELRKIADNEYDFGSSLVYGLGLTGGYQVGTGVEFGAGLKYYAGNAGNSLIDLTGYQLSLSLTGSF